MRFKDKVCLVTGGASGIGRATAIAFAREGAKLVVADISKAVEQTVNDISSLGAKVVPVICDISDWNSVLGLVNTAVEAFGQLDHAVNAAGIAGDVSLPIHEYPEDQWHRQLAVNLTGSWYFLKATTYQMLQSDRGEGGGRSIVLVASAASLRGQPHNSPYAAAKHGVVGLTKTAALEYAKQQIRINCTCPTAIETPMIMYGRRKLAEDPEALEAAKNYQALGRMGRPEEVAQVNLWLCSDESSFITGHSMPVDGGALSK